MKLTININKIRVDNAQEIIKNCSKRGFTFQKITKFQ